MTEPKYRGQVTLARTGVLLMLLAGIFTASCKNSTERLVGIPGLAEFDALTYHAKVDHSLELFEVETPPALGESEWQALVLKQRSGGLSSLSSEERLQLLAGGMRAFLSLVNDAQFRYSSGELTATAEELYKKDPTTGFYLDLLRRRATYDGIEVEWSGILVGPSGEVEQRTDIFDETSANREGRRWSTTQGVVICVALWDDGGANFAQTAHFHRYSAPAAGQPSNSGVLHGREVEIVEVRYPTGFETTYWLDRISLFPIRWTEVTILEDGTTTSLTADLVGVNQSPTIEAPAPAC